MGYSVEIIADSVNPVGCRLTSFVLEYPRFIHAELLTHRVFSKNSASSRAIKSEVFINRVTSDPAVPVHWGKNQKGMGAEEEVSEENQEKALNVWLESRDLMISQAKKLEELGIHKQITNRLLEPWFNIKVILSGTDFDNFFLLRCHPDAQPEIQKLAYMMRDAYEKSRPNEISAGRWHLPFSSNIEEARVPGEEKEEIKRKIIIARCARVSFLNFEGKDDYNADIKLCDRLFASDPKHLSPTEHVAMALDSDERIGNFRGWKQYRKFIEV